MQNSAIGETQNNAVLTSVRGSSSATANAGFFPPDWGATTPEQQARAMAMCPSVCGMNNRSRREQPERQQWISA
jgi:hypothetical protein